MHHRPLASRRPAGAQRERVRHGPVQGRHQVHAPACGARLHDLRHAHGPAAQKDADIDADSQPADRGRKHDLPGRQFGDELGKVFLARAEEDRLEDRKQLPKQHGAASGSQPDDECYSHQCDLFVVECLPKPGGGALQYLPGRVHRVRPICIGR